MGVKRGPVVSGTASATFVSKGVKVYNSTLKEVIGRVSATLALVLQRAPFDRRGKLRVG